MDLRTVLRRLGITATYIEGAPGPVPANMRDMQPFTVTLKRGRKTLTTPYFMGSAHRGGPQADDVIASLVSDVTGVEGRTFEDWASEYGYDTDSRAAERTFNACVAQIAPLRDFLGRDFDVVAEAAHNH